MAWDLSVWGLGGQRRHQTAFCPPPTPARPLLFFSLLRPFFPPAQLGVEEKALWASLSPYEVTI